jgi:uncharacterized membrane protein
MDIRDVRFWKNEAIVASLGRRLENYAASLLPYQKKEIIKQMLDETKNNIYSIENEEEIEKIEQMARKRLMEIREKNRMTERK